MAENIWTEPRKPGKTFSMETEENSQDHPPLQSAEVWSHAAKSMLPWRSWEEHATALSLLDCPVQTQVDFQCWVMK